MLPVSLPVSLHVPRGGVGEADPPRGTVSSAYRNRRAHSSAEVPARAAAHFLHRAHMLLGSVRTRVRARCPSLRSEDVDLERQELTVRVPHVSHEFYVRPS